MANNRVWTREEIENLLATNDEMVRRSLLKLYDRQTMDEKAIEETTHTNRRGFNHGDAKALTSIAKFLIYRGFLTPKQIGLVRHRIMKYAGQITRIANGEA